MKKIPSGDLNYLLITPRTTSLPYPENKGVLGGALWPVPMGMAYVSASVKTVSRNVYNLNLDYEPGTIESAIANAIGKYRINVVFTGGLAGQYSKLKAIVDTVKAVDEDIIVVVGGRCISPIPVVAMDALAVADIGIIGEGEVTSCELVQALNAHTDLREVNGLIYKNGDRYEVTEPRADISDLDSLPFPDFAGLQCEKIFLSISTASVVAARSCPFNCTFCYGAAGKYRMRSIDNIIREIDHLVEVYKVNTIAIIDELFVSNEKRILEFCRKIKPYNIQWGCTIHATSAQQAELLQTMREAGCCSLNLGVESASAKVLKSMNKRASREQIAAALENIQKAKIGIIASMIFGDIVEDAATVDETLGWWRDHRQYPIELSRMYAIPGSKVYADAVRNGRITDEVAHLEKDCREGNFSALTKRQYNTMALRLTTEEAFYSYPPPEYNILSVDMEKQKTRAHYRCLCGFEGQVTLDGLLLSAYFRCPDCQQAYRLTLFEKYRFSRVRREIEKLLGEKGALAFWGLGREMQLLLREIELTSLEKTFVIDADVKKQGLEFLGKTVHPPEIIQTEKIATVVPSPLLLGGVHYTSTIEQEIEKYPSAQSVPFGRLLSLALPSGLRGN